MSRLSSISRLGPSLTVPTNLQLHPRPYFPSRPFPHTLLDHPPNSLPHPFRPTLDPLKFLGGRLFRSSQGSPVAHRVVGCAESQVGSGEENEGGRGGVEGG